jgi:outer membrane receptor for ferrienterochelin and colicin
VLGAPQSRIATPAAVYVISSEDLRRSGARTIVEALRWCRACTWAGQFQQLGRGSRGLTGSR